MPDKYGRSGGGSWATDATWSLSSNGPADTTAPTAADNVFLDASSGAITIGAAAACRSLNCTGYTNTLTHNAFTLSIGDGTAGTGNVALLFVAGMTYTISSATVSIINYVSTSATVQTVTTAGKTVASTTFSGVGGSWQLTDNLSAGATSVLIISGGTFDANGSNVTFGTFNSSGSIVRTITMGNGTWTFSGNNATIVNTGTVTNFTLNRGNPIICNYSGSIGTRAISTNGTDAQVFDFNITAGTDSITFINIRDLDFTGFAGTWTNSAGTHYGSLTVSTGMTVGAGSSLRSFTHTSGTKTLTSNTKTLDFPITMNGAGGTLQLADNLVLGSTRTLSLNQGTFDANGKNVTTGLLSSTGSGVRTITMGVGTWTVTGNNGTVWTTATITNLTLNMGNPVLFNYSGATGTRTITAGTGETTAFDFSITAGTDIVDSTHCRNLDFTGFAGTWNNTASTHYGNLTLSTGMTVNAGTNTRTFAGTSGTKTITSNGKTCDFPITFNGVGSSWQFGDNFTMGSTRTMTLTNGTVNGNGKDVSVGLFASTNSNTRVLTLGAGNWYVTGNNATIWDTGTTTGYTLNKTNPINLSYSGATGTRTVHHGNGGATAANSPDFNITAGTDIFTSVTNRNYGSLNFTGFSGTLSNVIYNLFGSLTISSGMTLSSGSNATIFVATTGTQVLTSNGKTVDFPITRNAVGGTLQLGDNLTMGSTRTFTVTTGTFDMNNKNLSTGIFFSSGSGVRAISLGSGTLTLTSAGTPWDTATMTNLTFNAGTSTIIISDTSASTKMFTSGSITLNNLTTSGGSGSITIASTGTMTVSILTLGATGALSPHLFAIGATYIITTLVTNGTQAARISLDTTSGASTFTFRNITGVVNRAKYCDIYRGATTGTGQFWADLTCIKGTGTTGWNFCSPGGLILGDLF